MDQFLEVGLPVQHNSGETIPHSYQHDHFGVIMASFENLLLLVGFDNLL